MKHYRDALIALDSSGTHTAMGNKFAKIAYSSEDITFRDLCLSLSKWWGYYLKAGWSRQSRDPNTGQPINVGIPKTTTEWREGYHALASQLRNYCEVAIARGKPEWMVLAERNGWRPPH